MSKHVRSALFYVLRRCGAICVKRGKKGWMEGEKGYPEIRFVERIVVMLAVIPLTETVLC